jgi:hypothetical protein
MQSDCAKLSAHVSEAAFDPIPDTAAQSHWSKALLHLGRASSACTRGNAAMDTDLMTKAGAEITTANGELTKATARIREIANGLN